MEIAKAIFYANIILENSEDPKKLWKSINNILHRFHAHNELRNVHPSLDIIFLMNTSTLATETEIKKLIMKSNM